MIGTSESRGKLITTAPLWSGRMCSSIIVSDRAPWMAWVLPNCPSVPTRLSDPMTRMFSAEVYCGGLLLPSRLETSSCLIPSTTSR